MACDEGGRRLSANDRLGFISPRVTSCSRLTAGGESGPEARHVQIGRAVTIHIAMASSSFQWTLSVAERIGKHADDDKAMQGQGTGPETATPSTSRHVRYQKLARTLSSGLESVDGPSHGCLVRPAKSNLLFPPVRPVTRMRMLCLP